MDRHHTKRKDAALRDLLPFRAVDAVNDSDTFLSHVEATPVDLLRRFYVLDVSSVAVPEGVDDIQHFIEQRYRSVLSAAHGAGWTVLTAIVGSESGISISLGFMTKDGTREDDPYVFERRLRGLLPGLDAQLDGERDAGTLLTGEDYRYGGLIAGIPTLKIDDERQYFNLPAVLRGMYGEKYALMLLSRPVPNDDLGEQLQAVWKVRDEYHKAARRMHQHRRGESISRSEGTNETDASSVSTTTHRNLVRRGWSFVAGGKHSDSTQTTKTTGRTTSTASERNWSKSLSWEEQHSDLLEIERIADHYCNRLLKAFSIGAWETSITFATATIPGRDILAGVLLGELAKPSTAEIPPPRAYSAELTDDRPILLPKRDDVSAVFPSIFASYLTSEELAALSAPPSENLPGYEVRQSPALSLTDVCSTAPNEEAFLGDVCDYGRPLEGVQVRLGAEDLAKHLFVCGLTGSGKTTTVKEILANVDVPFLVLESAKRDYRKLLGCPSLKGRLRVYTLGDTSIAPLRLNPFHILPSVQAGVHIDYLKAIFNASFSLYGPMPYIVEQCLHEIYRKRGWDLTAGNHPQLLDSNGRPDPQRYGEEEARCYFPTLFDLRDEVDSYVHSQLDYRGELSDNIRTAIITRLDSLAVGAKGLLFNSSEPLDVEELLACPTVLELEALSDDDDKAFVVGLLLTFISEYRQISDPSRNPWKPQSDSALSHVLVIEEAHRLLKNVVQERQTEQLGNPRGKAVEFFANVLSEMRSMGQGVVVVEQIPSKLLPDVIKNTNAKIVHRLVSRDDQVLLASTLGLEERESLYLTSLRAGHAICAKEGMRRPMEIKVRQSMPSTRVGDEKVCREMAIDADDEAGTMAIRSALGRYGDTLALRLLCTLACGEPSDAASYDAGKAITQVTDRLRQHDLRHSEPSIKKYLATGVVELLANGHFRLADGKVRGMTPIIKRILDGDEKAGRDFRKRLAEGWNTADARNGVIHRIHGLALDRALRARISVDDVETVNRIVTSYFIRDLWDVRHEITNQITARLGGSAWNR